MSKNIWGLNKAIQRFVQHENINIVYILEYIASRMIFYTNANIQIRNYNDEQDDDSIYVWGYEDGDGLNVRRDRVPFVVQELKDLGFVVAVKKYDVEINWIRDTY